MRLKLDSNFCDLLAAFHAHGVRYLIVGGWAVSVHSQPRATKDMDVFVSPEHRNIMAVYEALLQFGAPLHGMDNDRFLEPGTFFRVGVPPYQVDIFPEIPGVEFETCWVNRVEVPLDVKGSFSVNFISANDLITAKLATGRAQDLADVEAIRRTGQQRGKN